MKKIVVIGSSNTDMVVQSDHLPTPGETILGDQFIMNPGGKGANQAVAAAKLDGDVTFIARVGHDMFGQEALKGFQSHQIHTDYIISDEKNPSGIALIMVDDKGENCISVALGANAALSSSDIDQAEAIIEQAAFGLIQLEIPIETVSHAVAKLHQLGVKVTLNPAPAQALNDELLASLYCITPNESEAEILTGVKVIDEKTPNDNFKINQKSILNKIFQLAKKENE